MCFNPSPERRVPSPNRYMAFAKFCFCKNNKSTIDRLFCCFIEVTMSVVKSVSDGLRDCESETQLNLDRPLRISPGPRHLGFRV